MSVHIRLIGLCTAHKLGGSAPHRSGFGALFVWPQVCETERFPPINIQHKLTVHNEAGGKTGRGKEGAGGTEADLHSVRRQII